MADYDEAVAGAELRTSPDVISSLIPAKIKEMRTRRLGYAGLMGGKIHSVNWRFVTPDSTVARITLIHPNYNIPGYNQVHNQSATFTVPGEGSDGERSLTLSARIGGTSLNELGVDLEGDVAIFGQGVPTEASLQSWLDIADLYQDGCMNVVAYSQPR